MKILYFSWIRQKVGIDTETLVCPASAKNTGDLLNWLIERHPKAKDVLSQRNIIRVAKNQEYCDWDEPVSDQDEIAFFPPVTGG